MDSFYEDSHIKIYQGNALELLRQLPENHVQCCVTSPPYWGLRKYEGEQTVPEWGCAYGLEPSIALYVQHSIEILREIRRVLRKDGVCFWNIGDSYAGGGNYRGLNSENTLTDKQASNRGARGIAQELGARGKDTGSAKPKDLCLIPFRVALEAQADGWWVRSDIIWSKNNPMPESVRDRPTESHEYILMLTKSARYYYDAEAVKEPLQESSVERWKNPNFGSENKRDNDELHPERQRSAMLRGQLIMPSGRNLRSVWTFPTQSFKGAHFATFPEELPERCIKAATPEYGSCLECGKPWERIIENDNFTRTRKTGEGQDTFIGTKGRAGEIKTKTLGWEPVCKCNKPPVPALVLDPFSGSGTTLWVAKRLNRHAIGFDLSSEYCELMVDRNKQQVLL